MNYFSIEFWWVIAIAAVIGTTLMLLLSYRLVQGYQLSSYQFSRFFKWIKNTHSKRILRFIFVALMSVLTLLVINSIFYPLIGDYTVLASGVFSIFYVVLYLISDRKTPKKTPLKFTPRVIRMYVVLTVLLVGYAFLSVYTLCLGWHYIYGLLFMLESAVLPLLAIAAFAIVSPFEAFNNRRYIRAAKKRIAASNAKIIAVTGSCGKTSVKNFIYDLLSQKYRCVVSRDSYNTPLGVARTVLSDLKQDTQFLILEMGARNIGDIKYLAKIAPPDIAVITEIAPQHLEYFKTIENIECAKYELVENMKSGGYAVFGGESTKKLYEKCTAEKSAAYNIKTENRSVTKQGVLFTACSTDFCLEMLGAHNITNFLTAMLVAVRCGLETNEIAAFSKNLRAVPHRLELIQSNGDITVIDDTYNSNPVAAREAIDAVAMFDGRKVIITPGFAELGGAKTAAHAELAADIAKVFDRVVLIGKMQTADITEGLARLGYADDKISVYRTLDHAKADFPVILQSGDVVLLLNDLPDNYTEAE